VFIPASDGSYIALESWDIAGWYGQSLDNKPFLDEDGQGNIFVADPEANRVLMFNSRANSSNIGVIFQPDRKVLTSLALFRPMEPAGLGQRYKQ